MSRGILTAEMYDRVPALVEQGLKKNEIAELFGCTKETLQVQCSRRGISLRKGGKSQPRPLKLLPAAPLDLSDTALLALRERAQAMGIDTAKLARDLLETIAKDDLYVAVLDLEEAA
jgi:hypothetical protein